MRPRRQRAVTAFRDGRPATRRGGGHEAARLGSRHCAIAPAWRRQGAFVGANNSGVARARAVALVALGHRPDPQAPSGRDAATTSLFWTRPEFFSASFRAFYAALTPRLVQRRRALSRCPSFRAGRIVDQLGAAPEKVVVIGNGVSAHFRPQSAEQNCRRTRRS